ncbi:Protein of unknown function [Lactobacillus helveticus CIRM-BIA 953]
MVLNL